MAFHRRIMLLAAALVVCGTTSCSSPRRITATNTETPELPWQAQTLIDISIVRDALKDLEESSGDGIIVFVGDFRGDYVPEEPLEYGEPRPSRLVGDVGYFGFINGLSSTPEYLTNISFDPTEAPLEGLWRNAAGQPRVGSGNAAIEGAKDILQSAPAGEIRSASVSWDGHRFFLIATKLQVQVKLGYGANIVSASATGKSTSILMERIYVQVQLFFSKDQAKTQP